MKKLKVECGNTKTAKIQVVDLESLKIKSRRTSPAALEESAFEVEENGFYDDESEFEFVLDFNVYGIFGTSVL